MKNPSKYFAVFLQFASEAQCSLSRGLTKTLATVVSKKRRSEECLRNCQKRRICCRFLFWSVVFPDVGSPEGRLRNMHQIGQCLFYLLLVSVILIRGEAVSESDPFPEAHPTAATDPLADPDGQVLIPTPVRIDMEDDLNSEVKKDRSPLLRSAKILPFLHDPFRKRITGLPGPVGVSLGLGLTGAAPVLPLPVPVVASAAPVRVGFTAGVRPHARVVAPECAINEKYCLFDANYPLDKVNSIIDHYYNTVRLMYADLYQFPPQDVIYYDNRTHSYRSDGHFVCESGVQYVRPGWAQNLRGDWVTVINTDKFPQVVRVETCLYKDKRCEYLPPCYKSRCEQRYTYVKLLCADPFRPSIKPKVEVFEIPSACSCFVENFTYY